MLNDENQSKKLQEKKKIIVHCVTLFIVVFQPDEQCGVQSNPEHCFTVYSPTVQSALHSSVLC